MSEAARAQITPPSGLDRRHPAVSTLPQHSAPITGKTNKLGMAARVLSLAIERRGPVTAETFAPVKVDRWEFVYPMLFAVPTFGALLSQVPETLTLGNMALASCSLVRLPICVSRSVSGRTSPSGPATDQIDVPSARSPAIDINDSQILKPGVGPRAITALALASLIRWSTCRGSSIRIDGKGDARRHRAAPRAAISFAT